MANPNRRPIVYRKAYRAHLLPNPFSIKKRGILAAIEESLSQAGFGRKQTDLILRKEIKKLVLTAALEYKAKVQQEELYSIALQIIEASKGPEGRKLFMEAWKKNGRLIVQAGEDFHRRN